MLDSERENTRILSWHAVYQSVFFLQPEMVAKGGHQGGQKVAKKMAKNGLKMVKDEHAENT